MNEKNNNLFLVYNINVLARISITHLSGALYIVLTESTTQNIYNEDEEQ